MTTHAAARRGTDPDPLVRAELLAQAGEVLASSLDPERTLRHIAETCVPVIADWCVVYLAHDRAVHAVTSANLNEDVVRAARRLSEEYPFNFDQPLPAIAAVLEQGRPILIPEVSDATLRESAQDERHFELLRAVDIRSSMLLPLTAHGQTLGAVVLSRTRGHGASYGSEDLVFAERLSRLLSLAVENAQLYRREREARQAAEDATERSMRLQRVAFALSNALAPQEAVRLVVHEGLTALGARAGSVALLSEDGQRLDILAAIGYPERMTREFNYLPLGAPYPLNDAARGGAPIILESLADRLARYPHLAEAAKANGEGAMAAIPLIVHGRVIGAMGINFDGPRHLPEHDRSFLLMLAQQCAQAVERGRLFEAERAQRLRAEAAQERTERILESITEGFYTLDHDWRFRYVNAQAERVLGRTRSELIGRNVWDVFEPAMGTIIGEQFRRAVKTRAPAHFETYYAPFDAWFDVHAYPAQDGLSVYFRDITAQRAQEAQIEELRRQVLQREKMAAMGSLVSGVAHEIRTPLTYIANNLYAIEQRAAASPDLAETLKPLAEGAMQGVERVNELVKQLRRFTKDQTAPPVAHALDEVVREAVALFQATHQAKAEVRADLAPTGPIMMDRIRIQQVVLNLLENAVDASAVRGLPVTVRTSGDEHNVFLEVEDEGEGIPPEVEARMFEPLVTTKPEGTGLGLSIVRRIVEAHGGSIVCRTKVGVGTTFTVRFPRAA